MFEARPKSLWCRICDAVRACHRGQPRGSLPIAFLFFATLLGGVIAFGQTDLARARQSLDAGQIEQAIHLLESYRDSRSDDAEVYNLLGIAYDRSGDSDRALAMFLEFARLAPNRPQAFNNLGAAYLHRGNMEQAETAFRRALRLSPDDVGAMYNLGSLLNVQKKFPESRVFLDRAYAKERSDAIAYELAVALAGSGGRKRALRILSAREAPAGEPAVAWLRLRGTLNLDVGDLRMASKDLERALALAPEDQPALSALALVRIREGRSDLGVELLNKTYPSLRPPQRRIQVGSMLASYGAYPQALEQFELAAEEDPTSYDAFYNIAVLKLDQTKDLAGALAAAQEARASKDIGEIHNLLGDVLEAQGKFIEAIDEYQEAVRLDPDSDKFAFDLGTELILHENHAAALAVFQAAQERFPKSSRTFLGLGAAEFLDGKTDESVSAFLKAVDLNPGFEPAYVFLGEAYIFSAVHSDEVGAKLAALAAKEPRNFGVQYYYGAVLIHEMDLDVTLDHLGQAGSALHRASALKPRDARVFYQLGELSRLQKRLPESIPYYKRAIALDPEFPEPLYKLGQVYVRLGKTQEGKQILALHKDVLTRTDADLYRRSGEIQSFVLKRRNAE
jgi:tetratricopeptide (TPR) repeat protein